MPLLRNPQSTDNKVLQTGISLFGAMGAAFVYLLAFAPNNWHNPKVTLLHMANALVIKGLTGAGLWFGLKKLSKAHIRQLARQVAENPEDPWPQNTKVYAATLAHLAAFGYQHNQGILDELHRRNVHTMDQAFQNISGGVGKGDEFHVGVASAGPTTGWDKREARPRYVIVLSGQEKKHEKPWLKKDGIAFMRQIREIYDIPKKNTRRLHTPDEYVAEGPFVFVREATRNQPDAEVLLFISAHGNLNKKDEKTNPFGWQGSQDCNVQINRKWDLTKSKLKSWVKQHLSHVKSVVIIVDSCHAGGWVA